MITSIDESGVITIAGVTIAIVSYIHGYLVTKCHPCLDELYRLGNYATISDAHDGVERSVDKRSQIGTIRFNCRCGHRTNDGVLAAIELAHPVDWVAINGAHIAKRDAYGEIARVYPAHIGGQWLVVRGGTTTMFSSLTRAQLFVEVTL